MSAILCMIMELESGRKEGTMAKRGVSSKTHTKAQLDDYANQHNPNNRAYQVRKANEKSQSKKAKRKFYLDDYAPLDWMCYSNPFDLE